MTEDEKSSFYKALGDNIRIARENAGLRQGAFGELIGLSRTSVVNIEKGRQHAPVHLVGAIAKVLGITYNDFIPTSKPVGRQSEASVSRQSKDEIDESLSNGLGLDKASIDRIKSFIDDSSST